MTDDAGSAVLAALLDAIEGQDLYHGRHGTTPAGQATAMAILAGLRSRGYALRAALPARSDEGLRTREEWAHPEAPWSGLGLCGASDARPGYGCVLPNHHDGDHDYWHRSALRVALAAADRGPYFDSATAQQELVEEARRGLDESLATADSPVPAPELDVERLHADLEAFADDLDADGHGHLARRLRAIWRTSFREAP